MASSRRLFLCVDCGGTKTAAVVSDEAGNVVSRGSGGPSNFMDVGMTAFLRAVKTAVEAALHDAVGTEVSLPTSDSLLSAAWFGISGCDSPASIAALQPPLSSLLSLSLSNLIIANDSHLLASPLSSHPTASSAVVVIAGTGSNCMSFKRKTGGAGGLVELGRSGGWGWILGDEGSGFFVGRTAVRYILTQWDRASVRASSDDHEAGIRSEVNAVTNKPTLRARIFSHFDITSPPDLFSVVYTADPPPLHPSDGASANAPPPSPGPVTSSEPTTPDIVVEPADKINLAPPPKPQNGTQTNPNIFLLERKHRLTSLTPLIFSSAFDDNDPDALKVLRTCARSLAEHINNLMLPANQDAGHMAPKAVRAEETLLCFGGSLVGIKKYRALVVDELGRIRKGLGVGEGEADEPEGKDEGRGVVAGVVFVADAAVSGAVGIASGFSG
ncbi:N-acetylmuramic acid 6-phosphate etherase [Ceratobasidium sp. AG-Ba]|nr:N-acetylmuramic acid 6-phosphate etherase [Ceratobasidium sp. AG-Ba]